MTKKVKIEVSEEIAKAVENLQSSESLKKQMAKNKANGDRFVQINTKILRKQSQSFTNINQHNLWMFMIDRMRADSNALMVSQSKLAGVLCCSVKTVQRTVKKLEELQYIRVIKVQGGNCYVVNADVAWKTGRDKKDTAIFNATIIAEWDEQSKEHYDRWTERLIPIPKTFIDQLQTNAEKDKVEALRGLIEKHGLNGKKTKKEKETLTDEDQLDLELENFIKGE